MKHFQVFSGEFRIIVVGKVKTDYNVNDGKVDKNKYRILKINRTTPFQLRIEEDSHLYSEIEMNRTIVTLSTGYKAHGGLKYLGKACAIFGFTSYIF
jgi:hypothetical protein